MWIFLKDSFFSVVAHRDKPKHVMVRARYSGDIRRVFKVREMHTPDADYPYRAVVTRDKVARMVSKELKTMEYDNFKSRAASFIPDRMPVLHQIWQLLVNAGGPSRYQQPRRAARRRLRDVVPHVVPDDETDCNACEDCHGCPLNCAVCPDVCLNCETDAI